MNKYELMKMSDRFDDDGVDECELNLDHSRGKTPTQQFEESYKNLYSDIKTNQHEDW